jgi:copper chaperone
MQSEHLKVTGMTCGGCVTTVTRVLKSLEGVDDVKVSLSGGDAAVRYDERLTSPHKLKLAVTAAGYGVGGAKTADAESSKNGCCS